MARDLPTESARGSTSSHPCAARHRRARSAEKRTDFLKLWISAQRFYDEINDNLPKRYRKQPAGTWAWDYACAENNRNPISGTGRTLTLGPDGKPLDKVVD